MKTILKLLGGLLILALFLGGAGFLWASGKTSSMLDRTVETHSVDFPIPFPLDSAEIADAELSPDEAEELALERAVERGRHLVEARYACSECHGEDFGGGVMVDDPAIGRLLGPNITTGRGSRAVGYTPADWDRIVRHGVRPDGRPAAMPSEDFKRMSDRELSDVVAYIRSVPPVDAEVEPVSLGPLGKVLMALGELPLSADVIGDHQASHAVEPPASEVSVEFGRHVAGVCMGCHKETLIGGKVPGGDPSWPPASNLTPSADGIGEWSYEDFVRAVSDGVRPDGTEIAPPMDAVFPYMRNMSETELRALWEYLRSVEPITVG